jgi:membrane-associated protein
MVGSMDRITQIITAFLSQNQNPLGILLLGLSALIEYVFPPFPGDTVTLFGAFLITRYRWSLPWSFASILAGSGAGAMMDFYLGLWLGERYRQGRFMRSPAMRKKVERVLSNFARYGEAYIALNRFLPGMRAVFFLAAGMAQLRPLRVLFFALLSAAVWNALIIAVGYALGANWARLKELFSMYTSVFWGLLLSATVVFLAHRAYQLLRAWRRGQP